MGFILWTNAIIHDSWLASHKTLSGKPFWVADDKQVSLQSHYKNMYPYMITRAELIQSRLSTVSIKLQIVTPSSHGGCHNCYSLFQALANY